MMSHPQKHKKNKNKNQLNKMLLMKVVPHHLKNKIYLI